MGGRSPAIVVLVCVNRVLDVRQREITVGGALEPVAYHRLLRPPREIFCLRFMSGARLV